MKTYVLFGLLFLCVAHTDLYALNYKKKHLKQTQQDTLKNKTKILRKFAKQLNYLSHYYKDGYPRKYSVTDDSFYNFYVADIVDTTNSSKKKGQLYFANNHIYVFSSLRYTYLYYNVAFIQNGKIIYFLGINCKNYINSINEVLVFAEKFLQSHEEKLYIIERLKNYRNYEKYHKLDNYSYPSCE